MSALEGCAKCFYATVNLSGLGPFVKCCDTHIRSFRRTRANEVAGGPLSATLRSLKQSFNSSKGHKLDSGNH